MHQMWEVGLDLLLWLLCPSSPVEGVGRLAPSLSCDGIVVGALGSLCTYWAGNNPRLRAFGLHGFRNSCQCHPRDRGGSQGHLVSALA